VRELSAVGRRALLDRTFEAAVMIGARSIGIAGGVSANSRLRPTRTARGRRAGCRLPASLALSTGQCRHDCGGGLRRYHQGIRAGLD